MHAVLRHVGGGAWHKRVPTVALVLLVGLTPVVAVAALGPTMADKLASVAGVVAAVAAACWPTCRTTPPAAAT